MLNGRDHRARHGKNGWLFSNKDGGWEYLAF